MREPPEHTFFLALFLASTPIACYFVFYSGQDADRAWWALANSYGFSLGMLGLFLHPLLTPRPTAGGFAARVRGATLNWLVWLSVFTQLTFQVPHNLFVSELRARAGTLLEWPFWSYGLSDCRWNDYSYDESRGGGESNDGAGAALAPAVWLININDAGLGAVVGAALLYYYRSGSSGGSGGGAGADPGPTVLLALAAVFRDATLWRETVEYMWDHHRLGYPHTVGAPTCTHRMADNAALRPHAIACLWAVNICWLLAPCLTVLWAFQEIMALCDSKHSSVAKRK